MPTATAYVRVSSKAQDLSTQRDAIERAAQARGDSITTWVEEKRSAKTLARPGLDRLRADARSGLVRRLYVFKLDRLCRTGVADTFAVLGELRAHGVEVIAVADNLHLKPGAEDITSEVFVFALGLAAKLERAAINDRISAARERVERGGGRWGRPRRLDDAAVQQARQLQQAGRSVRAISIALKVPRATVARALSRKPAAA
jgi:site-specific DNA recombinase